MYLAHCPSRSLIERYTADDTHPYDVAVVVDALRATATITHALAMGARCVVPLADAPETLSHVGEANALVAVERGGKRMEGAQLGNDPAEYKRSLVAGKTIYLSTTNGTGALRSLEQRSDAAIYIGAFTNLSAVAQLLSTRYADATVLIVGAGWKGRASLEDSLFAGYLAQELMHRGVRIDPDDGTYLALLAAQHAGDGHVQAIAQGEHFKRLRAFLPFEAIAACLQRDTEQLVPRYDRLSRAILPE